MAHRKRRNRIRKSYASKRLQKEILEQFTSQNTTKPVIEQPRYVTVGVQTEDELPSIHKKKAFDINELESVARISHIPIVESGWSYAEGVYKKIKGSSSLIHWTLDTAEQSAQSVYEAASPAMILLKGPLSSLDQIVCKSLDIVEQTVPSINLPPEMIYWNTKQYVQEVGTKIAQPVLKRADSVKQIGNSVLSSKYTAIAADTLDGALVVAEKYVDKYLPAQDDQASEEVSVPVTEDGPKGKAISTIHHADRFSRKLRRRLTQRTIAEVKALKHQSAEAVHVLTYVLELIATDPVLAYQKGKELWASLSKDEPENQARPENLEQLIVLLTRESARRVVHLINFSSSLLSTLPKRISYSIGAVVNKFLALTDSAVKTVHMENVQEKVVAVLKAQAHVLALAIKNVNNQISEYLEQIAEDLSKRGEKPKAVLSVPQITVNTPKATLVNSKQNANGVENNYE
ncbi:lipid storage droplets surface-binding protein 1-like isoform X1 [Diabrotica undecimpunctata]|uniref:lipid storage droplets surface-binding protein 1-like isoform X1 n=1 Tax=Diabrotica undecimpunctata TaxID=50387 RepID=UPI003B6337A8